MDEKSITRASVAKILNDLLNGRIPTEAAETLLYVAMEAHASDLRDELNQLKDSLEPEHVHTAARDWEQEYVDLEDEYDELKGRHETLHIKFTELLAKYQGALLDWIEHLEGKARSITTIRDIGKGIKP